MLTAGAALGAVLFALWTISAQNDRIIRAEVKAAMGKCN